jgi:hypothetical protein
MAKHELNHIKNTGQPHCKMFNSCFVKAIQRFRSNPSSPHPKNTHNLSTSTYRQTKVEIEVRHLKQKNISASVFPDIFFPQVTSTKTCCDIYVWPTQTNMQKENIFSGEPKSKKLKKKSVVFKIKAFYHLQRYKAVFLNTRCFFFQKKENPRTT